MSSIESVTINFFDINGDYEEDVPINAQQNFLLLESPKRIIELYINEKFLQDIKNKEDQNKIEYTFSYEINQNNLISINCEIINNFSVSHQSTLDSNGYIVFCNLESDKTYELLKKIVEYIKDNCSVNIKTYIIGVFKENINEDNNFYDMKQFLSSLNFDYDYYEMYIGDKNINTIIKKEYENAETMDEVFKNVFKEIYEEGGKGPRFSHNINQKDDFKDKSMGICVLF